MHDRRYRRPVHDVLPAQLGVDARWSLPVVVSLNGRQSRCPGGRLPDRRCSECPVCVREDEAKFYRVVPAGNTTAAHNSEGEEDYKIHSK
jgi:hypothetical protein